MILGGTRQQTWAHGVLITLCLAACGCGRLHFERFGPDSRPPEAGAADGQASDAGGRGPDGAAPVDGRVPRDGGSDGGGADADLVVDAGSNPHGDPDPRMTCPVNQSNVASLGTTTIAGRADRGNGFRGSCGGDDTQEDRVELIANETGRYTLVTNAKQFDTVLYVRANSCTGPELGCSDDVAGTQRSRLELELQADEPVYVFVDGVRSSDASDYELILGKSASTEVGYCADGMDNDADDATDCADGDCALDAACTG